MSQQEKMKRFELGVECFANAILYSLSVRPESERTADGIHVPINEDVWQNVFDAQFPNRYSNKSMQSLARYRGYFNRGEHGMGYDSMGKRDFGLGERVKDMGNGNKGRVGKRITKDSNRVVSRGKEPVLTANKVIGLTWDYLKKHHPQGQEIAKVLAPRQRNKSSRKPIDRFATASAIEGQRTETVILISKRHRGLRNRAFSQAKGLCCVCDTDFSKLLGGRGVRVLQVHHQQQLSASDVPRNTTLDDLAVVCANCHMLLHLDAKRSMKVETLRSKLRKP